MAFVTMGVHFGQKREPTTIAIAEIEERKVKGRYENHFLIRPLERLNATGIWPPDADLVYRKPIYRKIVRQGNSNEVFTEVSKSTCTRRPLWTLIRLYGRFAKRGMLDAPIKLSLLQNRCSLGSSPMCRMVYIP